MTALRILNVVVWGAMFFYMLPGAWATVSTVGTRRGDPMRLACLITAFVMVGFNLRWLIAPENIWTWQALYILSAGVGVYIMALAWSYGRGPRV